MTEDTREIVDRLRDGSVGTWNGLEIVDRRPSIQDIREAADTIERLTSQLAEAREKAIAVGARPITKRQLSAMAMLRRWGAPMGSPEDAMERLLAFNKSRATLSASDTRVG